MTNPFLPWVLVEAEDGAEFHLVAGDLLGRSPRSAVPLQDPRVSEAHALVSLRTDGFVLLALRGAVWTGERWGSEVALERGRHVKLAEGVTFRVKDVQLPHALLALLGLTEEPRVLNAPQWSLFAHPLRAEPRFDSSADAWVWASDGLWWRRLEAEEAAPLDIGDRFTLGGRRIEAVGVQLDEGRVSATVTERGRYPALDITIGDELTTVRIAGREVRITGRPHDILRHTALLTRDRESVHWSEVAQRIWKANPTEHNWYRNRTRLAATLREAGLPHEIHEVLQGQVRLCLRDEDTLVVTPERV
ncbi:MAG: hypothetical protein AAF211_17415 [Myxococcota bacterium]